MKFSPRILSATALLAVTCVFSAAAYFYKTRATEINEVMVFCKLQYNAYNFFGKLISFVEAAKKSVNVCMPGIHNPAIQGRLVQLMKEKNIKIRIIMDKSGYNSTTKPFIQELMDAGVEFKCKVENATARMHHKFCLVDDKVLMSGTLNWGDDRSSDHWNYVYITSKNQLVEPVKREFYQMWNQCPSDTWETLNVNSDLYDSDSDPSEPGTEASDEFENLNFIDPKNFRNTEMTPEICI